MPTELTEKEYEEIYRKAYLTKMTHMVGSKRTSVLWSERNAYFDRLVAEKIAENKRRRRIAV